MTKKTKEDKNTITINAKNDAEKTKRMNELSVSANMLNASLALPFYENVIVDVSLKNITNGLKQQIDEVQAGDITSIEAMLVSQANSLQIMFVSLGRKAFSQKGLPQYTAMFNLALKAQAQSRATIQALTELKYPKQTNFVKQANIANGHQQINNNQAASDNVTNTHAPAHAKEITNQPNELLSEMNNATLDTGGTATTRTINQTMATVAT
jgi:hypothetical protein